MADRSARSSDMISRSSPDRALAGLDFMVAVACGAIVANLYVAQPILADIADALGLSAEKSGLVVTLAQLGYCAGLLFIVPLGDVLENRRLSMSVLSLALFSAAVMATTTSVGAFLAAAFFLGAGLVTVQIMLPYAAALADPTRQGVVVGRVMSGILTGIMLSRPVSGIVAGFFGWRGVFGMTIMICLSVIVLIWKKMPTRQPANSHGYAATLRTLWMAARYDKLLRRRASYQFFMFYSYTLLWTVLPLLLAREPFNLTKMQIAAIALAGASGAFMSPVAGRIADKGLVTAGTLVALSVAVASWGMAAFAEIGGARGMTAIILAAVALDGAVPVSLVLSQRELFAANPEKRATYNGLFMAIFFVGGAVGASVGVWTFETFGWFGATAAGAAGPTLALFLASKAIDRPIRQN
jgi:predicted MFS family arabinose efflux permease